MYDKESPRRSQPPGARRNVRLLLAYDGTDYSGFQLQAERPTIQGAVEEALAGVLESPARIHGASRTDAGVHAAGQVASFRTGSALRCEDLKRALNSRLPASIRVIEAADAAPEFHARYSARSKRYRYRLYAGDAVPPWLARYVYHAPWLRPEGVSRMAEAAGLLVGLTDMACFRTTGSPVKDTRRTVYAACVTAAGPEVHFEVEASGFLRHAVRTMVGTLFMVARGRLTPKGFGDLVRSGRREAAGQKIPASGLWLERVTYDAGP